MKNSNIKETQEMVYASVTKRAFSFFIDYTIITFLRTFILQIFTYTFLAKHIINFLETLSKKFGEEFVFGQFTADHLQLFLRNSIFIELVLVILLVILVAPIYNALLIKSKIKTTLGKRIFKIYPKVGRDGFEPSTLRIFCHYFVSLIPVILAIGFISIEMLKYYKIIELQYPDIVIVIVLLAFVSWYDLAFVTKKHVMVHDLICGIVFISKGKKEKVSKLFSLNSLLEKQVRKIRQRLELEKEKTQVKKVELNKVIKGVCKAKKAKKVEIKKNISPKKPSDKKTVIKKTEVKKQKTKKKVGEKSQTKKVKGKTKHKKKV